MILITVGTQLPFDRLIRAVDAIAPTLGEPVFAQTGGGDYEPVNMEFSALISPVRFDELIRQTSLIISHAGIGSVLTAQKHRKPIILMPRRAALGEHRNDHQLATVSALKGRHGIYIADDEAELPGLLARQLEPPSPEAENPSRERLRETLAQFIGSS